MRRSAALDERPPAADRQHRGPSGCWSATRCSAGSSWPRWSVTRSSASWTPATGWDAAAWEAALEPYFDEHDEIGTGADARGPALLIIDEQPGRWTVRQIFDDPAGDHDWGITAEVDLAASDEAGAAVLRVTDVGQL